MRSSIQVVLVDGARVAAVYGSRDPALLEPLDTDLDEIDVAALTALRDAIAEQAQAERHVLDAIRGARDAGMSWAAIGNMVGTSGEAARQRYQPLVA